MFTVWSLKLKIRRKWNQAMGMGTYFFLTICTYFKLHYIQIKLETPKLFSWIAYIN